MDCALKFAVIFACYLHMCGRHALGTSDEGVKSGINTGSVTCAYYRLEMILLFKKFDPLHRIYPTLLAPFRGGGIEYLNDSDSYAGGFSMHLVGSPKPDRSRQPFSYLQETTGYKKTLLQNMNRLCPPTTVPKCHNSRYRKIDGTCNNIANPLWGSSFIAQQRYLQPVYDNGLDSPRTISVLGGSLPSTRKISNAVFKQGKSTSVGDSTTFTMMHMTFGQFLAHDIICTTGETVEDGTPVKCCTLRRLMKNRDVCFPIIIPNGDQNIKDKCMDFARSVVSIPDGENFKNIDETRQQQNEITSYIDASAVYGSTKKKMKELRSFNGGKLKLDNDSRLPEGHYACVKTAEGDYCENTGDKRVNAVPTLGSVHWLWVREHNRIADHLQKRHTDWNDEKIFQEARKIVIAMLQHIVYKFYLPTVIGEDLMVHHKLNVPTNGYTYNPRINAGTHNAFAAAAFRFGHSQIPKLQITTPIEKTTDKPHLLETNRGKGYKDFTTWLPTSPAAKNDVIFTSVVRNNLFPSLQPSFDLGAINTQRGRDHGIPGYNAWRVWAGLPKAKDFDALTHISNENILKMKAAYKHVDDIDLYPGGLSETHVSGGIVGPTFATLIGKQFYDYKFGDRFWYENNAGRQEGFTSQQLDEIRKITYARVICNNVNPDKIQRDVFKLVKAKINPLVPCSDIPTVNLDLW